MGYTPPNNGLRGNNKGHSSQPTGMPIEGRGAMPTGDRFDVNMAKMPQPPSATEPGTGQVPIGPWTATGNPAHVKGSMPDDSVIKISKR